jgi:hypothetical protein
VLAARLGRGGEDAPGRSGPPACEPEDADLEQIVADDIDEAGALGDPRCRSNVGRMAFPRGRIQIKIPQPAQVERWKMLAWCLNGGHLSSLPADDGCE